MIKKKLYLCIIGGMLLLTSCSFNKADTTKNQTVEKSVKEEIEVFGKIEATEKKDVYINFPAIIKEIYVKPGDVVKKGDKLLDINYDEYKNQIASKSKEIELNISELNGAIQDKQNIDDQINELNKSKAIVEGYIDNDSLDTLKLYNKQLDTLNLQIKDKEEEYRVTKELVEANGATDKELKDIEIELNKLNDEKLKINQSILNYEADNTMKLNDINLAINEKQEKITSINDNNKSATERKGLTQELGNLNITNMKEKLSQAQLNGNDVILDIDKGIIEKVDCTKDSYIGYSGPAYCMTILDANSIQVVADVPEEFIKYVNIGDTCKVIPYYDNTKEIKGTIAKISNMAQKQDGETIIKVYVDINEDDELIKPGLSVDVMISQ